MAVVVGGGVGGCQDVSCSSVGASCTFGKLLLSADESSTDLSHSVARYCGESPVIFTLFMPRIATDMLQRHWAPLRTAASSTWGPQHTPQTVSVGSVTDVEGLVEFAFWSWLKLDQLRRLSYNNNNNNNNIFNCKWAVARWQWLWSMYMSMK